MGRRRRRKKRKQADDFAPPITTSEKKLAFLLDQCGIVYEQAVPVETRHNHTYYVDFWIPGASMVIEVDGGYHRDRVKKDARRSRVIRGALGCVVRRIWNWHVRPGHACMNALVKEIRERSDDIVDFCFVEEPAP